MYDEVTYGPRNLGLSDDEIEVHVKKTLEVVGLSGYKDHHPYDLDHEKLKLLTIASILSIDPDILILDEPATEQDHKGRLL